MPINIVFPRPQNMVSTKFRVKLSNEMENFKRTAHQTLEFLWGILKVKIVNFKRD